MPIYEYRCLECGEKFEKLVPSVSSEPQIRCPKCDGHKVERVFLISTFGLQISSATGKPRSLQRKSGYWGGTRSWIRAPGK